MRPVAVSSVRILQPARRIYGDRHGVESVGPGQAERCDDVDERSTDVLAVSPRAAPSRCWASGMCGLSSACSTVPPTYTDAELKAQCERRGGWWRGRPDPGLLRVPDGFRRARSLTASATQTPVALRSGQWKKTPASMFRTWPVTLSERQKATT